MAGKNPRTYTKEFRENALVLASSMGPAKAAKSLGIPVGTIATWQRTYGKAAVVPATESPQDELKRLRKENDELKKVNYILKRAAAFFSQDQLK
jgi:transposase